MDLALEFLSKKLRVSIDKYKKKSSLIKHFKTQHRLSEWF